MVIIQNRSCIEACCDWRYCMSTGTLAGVEEDGETTITVTVGLHVDKIYLIAS